MTSDLLPVAILRQGGALPARAHPTDAGLDLVAADAAEIAPGARTAVGCGIALAVPVGWAGLVVPRSGLARHHGITVANAPGLVDSGYRGELQITLVNLGARPYTVAPGDRIAQLVLTPVSLVDAVLVDALPDSDGRGTSGFGSTG